MKFSSRMDVAASIDSLVHEPLRKKAKVEPKDWLIELQQPVLLLHAAACAAVSSLSARRDEILEDDDICRVVIDDVDIKKEDDSADAFVPIFSSAKLQPS